MRYLAISLLCVGAIATAVEARSRVDCTANATLRTSLAKRQNCLNAPANQRRATERPMVRATADGTMLACRGVELLAIRHAGYPGFVLPLPQGFSRAAALCNDASVTLQSAHIRLQI